MKYKNVYSYKNHLLENYTYEIKDYLYKMLLKGIPLYLAKDLRLPDEISKELIFEIRAGYFKQIIYIDKDNKFTDYAKCKIQTLHEIIFTNMNDAEIGEARHISMVKGYHALCSYMDKINTYDQYKLVELADFILYCDEVHEKIG